MTEPRKQTCGTRRGNGPGRGGPANGAGYGGPAKGSANRGPKTDFSAATNAQGHNQMTTAEGGNTMALRRMQAEGLNDVLLRIANDDARGASQVKAIETFQNRILGKPKETLALEGDAKKPVFVFMGVPEKESSEAWAKDNSPD